MLQPQDWYTLRDLAYQLDISMALARFAVKVLSNLGLISARFMSRHPKSPAVARSALPWIVRAVGLPPPWGSEWDRELSAGASMESLKALASQAAVPDEPEWYSQQVIARQLGLTERDLWPAICILQKLQVLQRRQHPPGVASCEIHRFSLPLLCHAATGRPDAYQQAFPHDS